MNFLSIDRETVIIDELQTKLAKLQESRNFMVVRTDCDISGLKAGDPLCDAGYNARERSRVPFSMNAVASKAKVVQALAAAVPGFVHRETGKCLDGKT